MRATTAKKQPPTDASPRRARPLPPLLCQSISRRCRRRRSWRLHVRRRVRRRHPPLQLQLPLEVALSTSGRGQPHASGDPSPRGHPWIDHPGASSAYWADELGESVQHRHCQRLRPQGRRGATAPASLPPLEPRYERRRLLPSQQPRDSCYLRVPFPVVPQTLGRNNTERREDLRSCLCDDSKKAASQLKQLRLRTPALPGATRRQADLVQRCGLSRSPPAHWIQQKGGAVWAIA